MSGSGLGLPDDTDAWEGEDDTPWVENALPSEGQVLRRLRTDPTFRLRFVNAALLNSDDAFRCNSGFHVERLEEARVEVDRLRTRVAELERVYVLTSDRADRAESVVAAIRDLCAEAVETAAQEGIPDFAAVVDVPEIRAITDQPTEETK